MRPQSTHTLYGTQEIWDVTLTVRVYNDKITLRLPVTVACRWLPNNWTLDYKRVTVKDAAIISDIKRIVGINDTDRGNHDGNLHAIRADELYHLVNV